MAEILPENYLSSSVSLWDVMRLDSATVLPRQIVHQISLSWCQLLPSFTTFDNFDVPGVHSSGSICCDICVYTTRIRNIQHGLLLSAPDWWCTGVSTEKLFSILSRTAHNFFHCFQVHTSSLTAEVPHPTWHTPGTRTPVGFLRRRQIVHVHKTVIHDAGRPIS